MEAVLTNGPLGEMSGRRPGNVALLRANNILWNWQTLRPQRSSWTQRHRPHRRRHAAASMPFSRCTGPQWADPKRRENLRSTSTGTNCQPLPALRLPGGSPWQPVTPAALSEAVAAADAGCTISARSFDAASMRFTIIDMEVGALLQSGRICQALEVAERLRREAADLPGSAQLMSTAVAGRAALGAGRLQTACSLLEQVVELFSAAGDTIGLGYRYQHSHAITLALLGESDAAAAALAALQERPHPSFRFMDFERALAQAWVAAGEGAVTEAIRILLSMAESARNNGRFAVEVQCLQAACQLGDHCCAPRLRELAAVVEGPRAGLAARFATGLRDGDGAELVAVSEEFERMGDVVAAVDAAAHAAIAFRRQDLRGSGYTCSTRAEGLAGQCGGACTPALLRAAEPLPLSSREREIAMLIGAGLSNRAIAARLTVSVRTVQNHIYRAMAKTGTASREDLAAVLPRRRP